MSESNGPQYSMKAASRLTGLSPDALRAWERRYGVVAPHREGKGRRLYTADDIERLSLLKRASDLGHPISRLAPLPNDELSALITAGDQKSPGAERSHTVLTTLLGAVEARDFDEFERSLGWIAATVAPRDLITRVIGPLLTEIGDRWHEGRMTIADEHAISGIVRNFMGSVIRLYPRRFDGGGVLFATVSGERHEFGILMLHLFTASEGIPSTYLGPDLPADEIARSAREVGCRIIALSAVNGAREPQLEEYRRLCGLVGDSAEIVVGGAAAAAVVEALPGASIHVMRSLEAFEARVRAMGSGLRRA